MSSNKILAIDIETTGLDPWRDEIHMAGTWDGTAYKANRAPASLITNFSDGADLVGHNVAFDIKFLQVKGWWKPDGRIIHDTKILAHLVKRKVPLEFLERYELRRKELNKTLPRGQTHREGSPLSLKVLAPWYLKVPMFWETPGNHDNEEYNQKDCMYTFRLFKLLSEQVKAEGQWDFYMSRMLEWSKMVMEMEIKGISISMEELSLVEEEYFSKRVTHKKKLDALWAPAHKAHYDLQAKEINETRDQMLAAALLRYKNPEQTKARYEAGRQKALEKIEPFNYSSPSQMIWLLKDYLKQDIRVDQDKPEDHVVEVEEDGVVKRQKNISTNKAVLNRLSAIGRTDVQTFLDWREADKVLTMYLPTYRELQVETAIHPSFNVTGTRTGRTSSSGPNLQQVPSKLYRLFKARPGHKFIQYDLSGIEAALIALYSGDRTLYAILSAGESIHDHNVRTLFDLDTPVSDVSTLHPRERKCAKNLGFACFYGAGWRRIKATFNAAGFMISERESKKKLDLLKESYQDAFAFHKEITSEFEAGETIINLCGRAINLQPHDNCYMQGFNTLIQSSASDLNLVAAQKYWKAGGSPLLLVHDFIMAEERSEIAEERSKLLVKCMTDFNLNSINGPIKLQVEGTVSENWEK